MRNIEIKRIGDSAISLKDIQVTKVEIIADTLFFLKAKGFLKKQWLIVREIPIYEITKIEASRNEVIVSWKDITDTFYIKGNVRSFDKLYDRVNKILETKNKSQENNEKVTIRRNEFLEVINNSIRIITLSFDVLIVLHQKRINWKRLDTYSDAYGANFSLTGETICPLSLDFSKIVSSIKDRLPLKTSNDAYNILKAIYAYFNGLTKDDGPLVERQRGCWCSNLEMRLCLNRVFKDCHLNYQNVTDIILAYYTLNDLLLGKIIGDNENEAETNYLETILQNVASVTNFKLSVEILREKMDKMDLCSPEIVIEDCRMLFKERLKHFL